MPHATSFGMGLQLLRGDNFRARLDWGIPLVSVNSRKRTCQENGIYFTLQYNPYLLKLLAYQMLTVLPLVA